MAQLWLHSNELETVYAETAAQIGAMRGSSN
jgi:hypothetical protein